MNAFGTEMSELASKEECVQLWKQTLLALKTNSYSAKDERGECVFGAGDEITHLALETNAFSVKDRTCLLLKGNVFGARDELTCLSIQTNTLEMNEFCVLIFSANLWQH